MVSAKENITGCFDLFAFGRVGIAIKHGGDLLTPRHYGKRGDAGVSKIIKLYTNRIKYSFQTSPALITLVQL